MTDTDELTRPRLLLCTPPPSLAAYDEIRNDKSDLNWVLLDYEVSLALLV